MGVIASDCSYYYEYMTGFPWRSVLPIFFFFFFAFSDWHQYAAFLLIAFAAHHDSLCNSFDKPGDAIWCRLPLLIFVQRHFQFLLPGVFNHLGMPRRTRRDLCHKRIQADDEPGPQIIPVDGDLVLLVIRRLQSIKGP